MEHEPIDTKSAGAARTSGRASSRRIARPSRWQLLHATRGMRVVRLATFFAALGLVVLGLGYARARGQIAEQMLSFGENLMRYGHAERQDEPRELRVNGQTLMLTSGTTEDSLDTVLDDFERRCHAHNAGLQAEVRRSLAQDLFVLRNEGERAGTVGCLDFGEDIGVSELVERATRFQRSNDLHDLGDLRYVYARELDDGHGVHFLTFWTTGSLNFDELTGGNGNRDVPGRDVAGIPRPPRSLRVIDASETGSHQRVVSYSGSSSTGFELEPFYREALERAGYHLTPIPEDARVSGPVALAAERDGRVTFVVLDTDARGRGIASIVTGD